MTREQAAKAAGVKPSAMGRIVNYAKAEGWIVARTGAQGGGYVAGDVEVPPATV